MTKKILTTPIKDEDLADIRLAILFISTVILLPAVT
ncbi:L(+)-tartrate dehydratase subunit beta [Salmonella enterica subsp. enterica]|nr:L(+)-tartrate dehydratase subunit beta [Salmonella enterica subsp. enterica]